MKGINAGVLIRKQSTDGSTEGKSNEAEQLSARLNQSRVDGAYINSILLLLSLSAGSLISGDSVTLKLLLKLECYGTLLF